MEHIPTDLDFHRLYKNSVLIENHFRLTIVNSFEFQYLSVPWLNRCSKNLFGSLRCLFIDTALAPSFTAIDIWSKWYAENDFHRSIYNKELKLAFNFVCRHHSADEGVCDNLFCFEKIALFPRLAGRNDKQIQANSDFVWMCKVPVL